MAIDTRVRCEWPGSDPLNLEHHDVEWGMPSRDRRHLFELLTLEGAQAGLSWTTILRKRDGYRAAFAGFEPERVAAFGPDDVDRLMLDPGIVRNRGEDRVDDRQRAGDPRARARRASTSSSTSGRSSAGAPIQNRFERIGELPSETAESKAMSKDLKKRGFRFVGPTILYAFMESAGLVNDHIVSCYRYDEVAARLNAGA